MTKIFSPKLFVDGLNRTKVFGIISIIITTVLSAFISVTTAISAADYATLRFVYTDTFVPIVTVMLLLAPFSVYMQFNFLNKRASSDFYHSLPFTRTQICVSFFASILLWVTATILAPIIVNTLVYSVSPWTAFDIASPFLCFAGYFCASFLLMSIMLVAMALTGTVISNILVFGIISLFFRLIFFIITIFFEEILPLVPSNSLFGSYLSPEFFLPFRILNFDNMFSEAAPMIYAFVVGILCTVCGFILFNRRKSESADKSAVSPIFQNIFRCAVSLPTTLLAVIIFAENTFSARENALSTNYTAITLFIVTLFVYFLYEIITQKGVSTIKKCIPQLFIVLGIAVGIYGGIKLTEYNVLSYSPSADEIESIQLSVDYDYSPSYEQINTSKIELKDKEAFKLVEKALDASIEASRKGSFYLFNNNYITLYINDINGNKKLRHLTISQKDYESLMDTLGSSPEFNKANLEIPTENEVNVLSANFGTLYISNISKDIWKCFTEEYNSLSDEDKLSVKFGDYVLTSITVLGNVDGTNFESYYPITPKLPKTFNMIASLCYSRENTDTFVKTAPNLLENNKYSYAYIDVTAFDSKTSANSYLAYSYFEGDSDTIKTVNSEKIKTLFEMLTPYFYNPPSSDKFIVSMTLNIDYETGDYGTEFYREQIIFSVPEEIYNEIVLLAEKESY